MSDIPGGPAGGISGCILGGDAVERGVHERRVLEALAAAGAGDVVRALLVQVEAQVLQLRVLPQQIALPMMRKE